MTWTLCAVSLTKRKQETEGETRQGNSHGLSGAIPRANCKQLCTNSAATVFEMRTPTIRNVTRNTKCRRLHKHGTLTKDSRLALLTTTLSRVDWKSGSQRSAELELTHEKKKVCFPNSPSELNELSRHFQILIPMSPLSPLRGVSSATPPQAHLTTRLSLELPKGAPGPSTWNFYSVDF